MTDNEILNAYHKGLLSVWIGKDEPIEDNLKQYYLIGKSHADCDEIMKDVSEDELLRMLKNERV